MLIANYLPQPNRLHSTINHENFGREARDYVTTALGLAYNNSVEEAIGKGPFGADDVAQMLPGLRAFAIEIMSFLDNGEFTFDDMSSDGDIEVRTPTNEDRPPTSTPTPMRTSEGKKETQTTTVPESSSFSPPGTNDTRTRTEGLPQRPVCEDRAEVPPVAPHRLYKGRVFIKGEVRWKRDHKALVNGVTRDPVPHPRGRAAKIKIRKGERDLRHVANPIRKDVTIVRG